MQALSIRMANGETVNPTDWTSSPYWTTVEISNATNLQPLPGYSYGEKGLVPGSPGPRRATKRDTNYQGSGGTLMANEEMLIFSFQIELYQVVSDAATFYDGTQETYAPDYPEVSATNLMRIQRSTYCRLKIANTKTYSEEAIGYYGAGQGIHRSSGPQRSQWSGYLNGSVVGYNGDTSVGGQRQFATPHHVNGGEALEFTLEFPYGSIVEPLSVVGSTPASRLNFGTDDDARIRAVISAIGPRRRPVA